MKSEATFILLPHLTFGLPSGLTLRGHLEVVVIHGCTWALIEFKTLCQVLATPRKIRQKELRVYCGKQICKEIITEQPINTVVQVRLTFYGNLDVIHFAELGTTTCFPKCS